MTPYAILLVKPTDSDEIIRKTYHVFARQTHSDLNDGKREDWEKFTAAYTAIKTAEQRVAWATKRGMLAGLCVTCEGSGVRGTRLFKGKVRLCEECKGEGRCA